MSRQFSRVGSIFWDVCLFSLLFYQGAVLYRGPKKGPQCRELPKSPAIDVGASKTTNVIP